MSPSSSPSKETLHKITPDVYVEKERFGKSIDISGNIMVVGTKTKQEIESIYVYEKDATSDEWKQTANLVPNDGEMYDNFGVSVAISGDIIVVGAPSAGYGAGAVYIFIKSAIGWVQADKILGETSAEFGQSVAIDSDARIVVGATGYQSVAAVYSYSFEPNTGTWKQTSKFEKEYHSYLGYSVSSDGGVTVAGAERADGGKGAVYIFEDGQVLNITSNDTTPNFGSSVAVSENTVVVSALNYQTGSAYVFQKNDKGDWEEVAKLFSCDAILFGFHVAISGNTILVGAPYKDSSSVFIYQKNGDGNTWSLRTKVVLANSSDLSFGTSMAISGDDLVFGSFKDADERGSIYIYKGDM